MDQLRKVCLSALVLLMSVNFAWSGTRSLEIKLTGKNDKTCNRIEFKTLSELSGSWFYLEASRDGKNFETLAIFKGRGDQQSDNIYKYDHQNVSSDITYYRVRESYPGGAYKYSSTLALKLTDLSTQVYPNPAAEHIMISGFSGKKFSIIDRNGKLIMNAACESANYKVDISFLNSGNYFLIVEGEKPLSLSFVKI